jgi:hypothetical protein
MWWGTQKVSGYACTSSGFPAPLYGDISIIGSSPSGGKHTIVFYDFFLIALCWGQGIILGSNVSYYFVI